jgi:muramidase (phage lysozyme)
MVCGNFRGYDKEPFCSDSAGRYHFLSSTWDDVNSRLNLPDFSPISQDLAAIELLREVGALEDIESGNLEPAIYKASLKWGTLPSETGETRFGLKNFNSYSAKDLIFIYEIIYRRYELSR